MTKPNAARRAETPAGPPLPPVTVARFEQVALLIEQLAKEKTSLFLGEMAAYRDTHRAAMARPLTEIEAASIAGRLAADLAEDDPVKMAADIQKSDLRAAEPLQPRELLLVAGTRTAPAFLDAALRVCALIEMPADEFEAALEGGELGSQIDAAAWALRRVPMSEARPRAARALEHFVRESTGGSPGEAWGLLTGTVWQAILEAISQLTGPASSSSTDLLEPTAGPAETSSTD